MNRSLVVSLATLSLSLGGTVHAQSAAPAPARMVAPPPSPASPIPGLRLSWSVTPASVHFDASHAPSTRADAGVGRNGFPTPLVPVQIVLRMHNNTASPIHVGDGSDDGLAWRLTLSGPGALSIDNRSSCRTEEREAIARWVTVPAGGDAEIRLDGLTSGGQCPVHAWFWSAPGRYTVQGSLHTNYAVGARTGDPDRGTAVTIEIPALAIDVTR